MVKEQQVHDHGFVRLIDIMGDDNSIADAARVSYGEGTRSVSDNRNLVRYLVRHKHTSPLEMVEVKFHLKLPIFVMRQLARHRTASLNEYSGRYSIMSNDCYVPELDYIQPQSQTNNQGRGDNLSDFDLREMAHIYNESKKDVIGLFDVENLELAKLYGIVEIKSYARSSKRLSTAQLELLLIKNRIKLLSLIHI